MFILNYSHDHNMAMNIIKFKCLSCIFFLISCFLDRFKYYYLSHNAMRYMISNLNSCYEAHFNYNGTYISSTFDELMIFVAELSKSDFHFSVICLQESWLDESHY